MLIFLWVKCIGMQNWEKSEVEKNFNEASDVG